MKKIFAFGIALLALVSCNMDFYSSDSMTSAQFKENPSAAVYTTDGIYALMKDAQYYRADSWLESSNTYIRHINQLSETRGDNVTISGHSTDPFLQPYRYEDVPTQRNIYYTWWIGYKMIYAANSNIESIDPSSSALSSQLLGENYFFRAMVHFDLVRLFAMPYVCGRGNAGIPLRRSMDYSATTRATVGDVYDGVVEDLKLAIQYMDRGSKRGDASYVSATAARALLSRVYLDMGDEHLQDCIDLCDELISKAPASVQGEYTVAALAEYPKHTWDNPETIWCLHHIYPTDLPSASSTIGAMYNVSVVSDDGWGEWYWNDELIELFNRYPEDRRFQAYFTYVWYPETVVKDDGKQMVCFPEKPADGDYCVTGYVQGLTPAADGSYTFNYEGKSYTAVPEMVGGYKRYFINANMTGDATFFGGRTPAYIRPDVDEDLGIRSGLYVRYLNSKYSGQDGYATFTSPVILRWAEVFLNKAEALARKGSNGDALDAVNVIRHRAGLSGDADFTIANYASRGYESVLDVVLDEERMEFCFEAHRYYDLLRNKKNIDRRYVGYHPFEVVSYNDPRIALRLPDDEINSTDLEQNPR